VASICETTDLHVPAGTARAHRNGFINDLIDGSQPGRLWLGLPWRRPVRESDREVVQFVQTGVHRSRMIVEVDQPGEPSRSCTVTATRDLLLRDLARFCENGECGAEAHRLTVVR
jgi:hypothetical protein